MIDNKDVELCIPTYNIVSLSIETLLTILLLLTQECHVQFGLKLLFTDDRCAELAQDIGPLWIAERETSVAKYLPVYKKSIQTQCTKSTLRVFVSKVNIFKVDILFILYKLTESVKGISCQK